jgi:hypothetical protein
MSAQLHASLYYPLYALDRRLGRHPAWQKSHPRYPTHRQSLYSLSYMTEFQPLKHLIISPSAHTFTSYKSQENCIKMCYGGCVYRTYNLRVSYTIYSTCVDFPFCLLSNTSSAQICLSHVVFVIHLYCFYSSSQITGIIIFKCSGLKACNKKILINNFCWKGEEFRNFSNLLQHGKG